MSKEMSIEAWRDRCKRLEGFLERERKEVVRLKKLVATLDARSRDRKKQADAMGVNQLTAHEAASAAVRELLSCIARSGTAEIREYLSTHRGRIRANALRVLDKHKPAYVKLPPRIRDEHAMPRHGKSSS